MTKRANIRGKTLEGKNTSHDHFRHTYNFVENLFLTIVDQDIHNDTQDKPIIPHHNDITTINYDKRKRIHIDTSNMGYYTTKMQQMIGTMCATNLTKVLYIQSDIYPKLLGFTTLGRELVSVLEHTNYHQDYFFDNDSDNNISHSTDRKDISDSNDIDTNKYIITPNTDIQTHFDEDIITAIAYIDTQYQYMSSYNIQIPTVLHDKYQYLYILFRNLLQIDNTQIVQTNTQDYSSVATELYKISEEMIHILYAIRVYLSKHDTGAYQKILSIFPNFGIAQSTLSHQASQKQIIKENNQEANQEMIQEMSQQTNQSYNQHYTHEAK